MEQSVILYVTKHGDKAMKVQFTAKQVKSNIPGRIILDLINPNEIKWVGEFLKKKKEYEEKFGKEKLLEIELKIYFRKKTTDQWGLYQELINRLAMKQNCGKDDIHRGIKYNCYPDNGLKSSADLNIKEMSKILEYTISECYEQDVDVRDIQCLWTKWRYEQPEDPLTESYRNMADYKLVHPFCEACLKPLLADEGQIAHIVSSKASGIDDPWNRLRLCTDCHIFTQHAKGWLVLIEKCPVIEPKVTAAWMRAGVVPAEYKKAKVNNQEEENQMNLF